MFGTASRSVPPPPGIPAPNLWGDEATVQERFRGKVCDLKLTRRLLDIDYLLPPDGVVAFFRQYFGPTNVAFSRLDADGQAALATELEKLWREHNQNGADRTRVHAECC